MGYKGADYCSDIETLQLLARWNERYGGAKWNPKGTYIGIQVNPAAVKAKEDAKKAEKEALLQKQEEKKAARKAKKKAKKEAMAAGEPKPLTATFKNLGTNIQLQKAELYYETTRWGNIGHGDPPISVGS